MDTDTAKIQDIFDYLSVQDETTQADGAFVFGRADALLAQLAAEAYAKKSVKYLLFTGGAGKDSGYLQELGVAEADFLAACANTLYNVPARVMYRETAATNAAENARFGISLIIDKQLQHGTLLVIAHATSLRRLVATLAQELDNAHLNVRLIKQATPYAFDPSSPADRLEACSELVKLDDYAAKGWCQPQSDLPEELLAYAKQVLAG